MFGDRQKVCSVLQIKLNTSKAFNSMTTMLGSTSPYQWHLLFITFIYQCSAASPAVKPPYFSGLWEQWPWDLSCGRRLCDRHVGGEGQCQPPRYQWPYHLLRGLGRGGENCRLLKNPIFQLPLSQSGGYLTRTNGKGFLYCPSALSWLIRVLYHKRN